MSKAVATLKGRENLAKARAGLNPLLRCKEIALGTGGSENGALKTPTNDMTAIYNEVVRRDITLPPIFKKSTTATYSIQLSESEFEDVIFNEIGLFDEEGTLIAIKTFNPLQKDGSMEMTFDIDDQF